MSCRLSLIIFTLFLSSCYLGENDYDALYSQVGQPAAAVPQNRQNTNNQAVPNYYYRYGPTVPASPEYAQTQQYQYQYNQQQYAPYPAAQRQQYAPYPTPASRFYSNPYDIPQQASPYYSSPYDADQYYVPPSYYYNQEQNQNRSNATAAPARSANP